MPEESEEGKNILMRIRPSRKRFVLEYSGALVSLLLAFLILFSPISFPVNLKFLNLKLFGSVFLLVTAFLLLSYTEIRRYVEHYLLTDTEVIEEIGFFDKRTVSLPYIKLERSDVREPFIRRMMGIGDIRVDTGQDYFIIQGIDNPEEVNNKIDRLTRETMKGGSSAAVND